MGVVRSTPNFAERLFDGGFFTEFRPWSVYAVAYKLKIEWYFSHGFKSPWRTLFFLILFANICQRLGEQKAPHVDFRFAQLA